MWNFDSADLSAIAAGISAFGTLAAAGSALASWYTSKKALQLQNRVYLYESLKACAERANTSATDKRGSEWSVNDAWYGRWRSSSRIASRKKVIRH